MAIIIACAGITATTKAQTWLLGGNPPNGGNGTVTNSNFFGTNAANSEWLRMGVSGNQDIFIDNLTGAPQLLPAQPTGGPLLGGHWVGLGRVFQPSNGATLGGFAPQAHLHIHGGGYLFRTDGNQSENNTWQLYTGENLANAIEKFNVTALANTNNVQITAPQGNLILKDATSQITLAEIIALKQEIAELKKNCWS